MRRAVVLPEVAQRPSWWRRQMRDAVRGVRNTRSGSYYALWRGWRWANLTTSTHCVKSKVFRLEQAGGYVRIAVEHTVNEM